jgi:haloacid dehalogenase-like hydrolase
VLAQARHIRKMFGIPPSGGGFTSWIESRPQPPITRHAPRALCLCRLDCARFSHESFNKGTALAEITRRLGLSPEAVFAAGDQLNDLPMLSRQVQPPSNVVPSPRGLRSAGKCDP